MATMHNHDADSVLQFADEFPDTQAFESDAGQLDGGGALPGNVEVRPFLFADCSWIAQLPYRFELRHPESDSDRPGKWQLMARRLLTGEYSSSPLFVARNTQTKQRMGVLQCLQHGVDDRWYLQYLASQEEVDDGKAAHIALLEHAIGQAGLRGARRIMARSEFESPFTGTLRTVGFTPYAREYVYSLTSVPNGTNGKRVRMQEKSDVWSIHQLYLQTTPRTVQNAEALTSHGWDIDYEGRSRRGWFIPTDSGASAYVRVRTNRKYHLLDAMYVPESIGRMPDLLHAVFNALRAESSRTIYIQVRGYQEELGTLLENLGFGFDIDQLLMVRYTTAPVPSVVRPIESFERLQNADTNARRVPSFYMRDVHE